VRINGLPRCLNEILSIGLLLSKERSAERPVEIEDAAEKEEIMNTHNNFEWWPPSSENWTRWFAIVIAFVVLILIIWPPGITQPPLPTPTDIPGTQSISGCESVVSNVPQDRLEIPANAIEISIYFSAEECQYLPRIALDFNRAYIAGRNPLTGQPLSSSERPFFVTGRPVSSGTVRDELVKELTGFGTDEFTPPTIWSPSSAHFLAVINEEVNRQIFDLSDVKATALAPVVMAIWESRLEAIRNTVGYAEIGWEELLAVMNSPNGWCDYGIPNCRRAVYYGHTNPNFSPTGLSTLIGEYYASARQNGYSGGPLTLDIVNNSAVRAGVREIEQLIRHYSRRTTEFKNYIAQGPDYVDFVALEENDVITINRGLTAYTPPERLVALYPKEGTFWHEHPFAVPDAPWVSSDQREAARIFTEYVLAPPAQELIVREGFRPANPTVSIGFPFDPLNGVTQDGPAGVLPVPSGEVILAIQRSWEFVKKQADIMLLLDTSGSMNGEKLDLAKTAAGEFVNIVERKAPDNRIGLTTFSDGVSVRVALGTVESNSSQIRQEISSLQAVGGTALYQAILETADQMRESDDGDRIRILVVLSDGADTASSANLNEVVEAIGASIQSRNPVIVIPIAYGTDADIMTLRRIAEAARTELQNAVSPDTIRNVLNIIAGLS
jgi:Ca-activated chloride channel homolog